MRFQIPGGGSIHKLWFESEFFKKEEKSFGESSIGLMDSFPKLRISQFTNDGVSQVCLVKYGFAAGHSADKWDFFFPAEIKVDSLIDFFVTAKGQGWAFPGIKSENRRIPGLELLKQMEVYDHVE